MELPKDEVIHVRASTKDGVAAHLISAPHRSVSAPELQRWRPVDSLPRTDGKLAGRRSHHRRGEPGEAPEFSRSVKRQRRQQSLKTATF